MLNYVHEIGKKIVDYSIACTHTMHNRLWLILFIVGSTFALTPSKNFKELITKRRSKRSTVTETLILSPESICERFSNPIKSNKTFFSPSDGTENYPSKVDCVLILEAGDDEVIQLDFRNNFNIENSENCEYDFLEVRDGQYGFSDSLGKHCGNQFPSIISSSDKYMWLHFHSDDNIEYIGFEGVYTFTPRPPNAARRIECFMTKNNSVEGFISQGDIDKEIKNAVITESIPLDCIWMIEVDTNWQISMIFEKFDLVNKNDCVNNFIDVYGNDTNISTPLKHFCAVVAEPLESKSNRLYIRFYANKATLNSNFTIYYSTFRKKEGSCTAEELDCEDDTCIIKEGLLCNDRSNCKFQKDEEDCPKLNENNQNDLYFIVIVFSALLGAMTSVFFFNCIRKLIRDQKIIRETIRQSKESKLDEAGRASLKRSLENVNRIVPKTAGYSMSSAKTIPIDDDVDRMYRESDSPSISDSMQRMNKAQYSYREQLRNILRNPPGPPETASNNGCEQFNIDGLCDIACQTRESLFVPGISSKLTQQNTQPPDTYKFSTFGYNPPVNASTFAASEHHKFLYRDHIDPLQHPHTVDLQAMHTTQPDNFEQSNRLHTLPNQYTTTELNTRKLNAPKKMEESRIMLEIRNSAPDVIIMTSH